MADEREGCSSFMGDLQGFTPCKIFLHTMKISWAFFFSYFYLFIFNYLGRITLLGRKNVQANKSSKGVPQAIPWEE